MKIEYFPFVERTKTKILIRFQMDLVDFYLMIDQIMFDFESTCSQFQLYLGLLLVKHQFDF